MNNPITPYQSDILSQPKALADTLEYLYHLRCPEKICTEFVNGKWSKIVLTGMGSSYFALYPLYLRLIQAGKRGWLVETSELIHYQTALIQKDTLVIAASQSGASAETVRLLDLCSEQQTIIGITNNDQGPLALRSTFSIITQAGEESAVSCKTYVTALAAQCWLGDHILDGENQFQQLTDIPHLVDAYLQTYQNSITEIKKRLLGIYQLYLTGRGISLATVGTGGLILKESTHVASEGLSSAGFRHGPFEMVSQETFLLVFSGTEQTKHLNTKLAEDAIDAGGRVDIVQCGSEPGIFTLPTCPDVALPILEILPVQMISLAMADLRGIQAGKFRFGNKITTDE